MTATVRLAELTFEMSDHRIPWGGDLIADCRSLVIAETHTTGLIYSYTLIFFFPLCVSTDSFSVFLQHAFGSQRKKKTLLTDKYLIMNCPKILSKKRWNGTWSTNSFSQQHASALPKSNVFYPKNFNGIQIVECIFIPSHDEKHYFQFPLLSSKCNRMRQPCEWVTLRVSHLAVKSHLLARSLLHSSLGSQPFSTLYPYLS